MATPTAEKPQTARPKARAEAPHGWKWFAAEYALVVAGVLNALPPADT